MAAAPADPRRVFLSRLLSEFGARVAEKLHSRVAALEMLDDQAPGNAEKSRTATPGYGGRTPRGPEFFDRPFFRPPGAIPEAEFLDTCLRCRKCVDVCPEQCIVPAQEHMAAPLGTPILFPDLVPCTLCGDCMDACPSGALLPIPGEFARIGLAAIAPDTCVAYGEEHCTRCHDVCPVTPNAVVFPEGYEGTSPRILADACTGCGLCVKPCPTTPKSITVRLRPVENDDGDDGRDGSP